MRTLRISYASTTLDLQHPATVHDYENESIGGERVLGNLQSESMVLSTHRFLELYVHFPETQYLAVEAWVAWCHANGMGPFTARLDKDDATTQLTYFLVTPGVRERWRPERLPNYHQAMRLRTVWRRSTSGAFFVPS